MQAKCITPCDRNIHLPTASASLGHSAARARDQRPATDIEHIILKQHIAIAIALRSCSVVATMTIDCCNATTTQRCPYCMECEALTTVRKRTPSPIAVRTASLKMSVSLWRSCFVLFSLYYWDLCRDTGSEINGGRH
jgi:hypothetical protein